MAKSGFKQIDKGWGKILEATKDMGTNTRVKVGAIDGMKERPAEDGVTNAQLLAIHEFGTATIPARPALSLGMETFKPEAKMLTEKGLKRIFEGKITVDQLLGLLGARAAAVIKNGITQGEGIPPPNAPSTIARKGSDRPLVDTGRMVDSISWLVLVNGVEGSKSE